MIAAQVTALRAVSGASLEVRDVFKIYKEGEVQTVALRGVSFALEPGELVAVVGRSGSGKSTLFSLLAGLTEPTAGQVLLDGRDLNARSEAEQARARRERIGVTFQQNNLISYLSALENVELPMGLTGTKNSSLKALELLRLVGLSARAHHQAAQLSGGEQARAALAVALANDPSVLLADEPTGELDTVNAEAIMNLLECLNRERGLTLLVVTHNPEVAARASRRVRLSDGVLTQEAREIR
jgi:putative ABC transport system ATP-binding protein